MPRPPFTFPGSFPFVVGSIGDAAALAEATPRSLAGQCDLAEIRLDLVHADFLEKGNILWRHLLPFPLLQLPLAAQEVYVEPVIDTSESTLEPIVVESADPAPVAIPTGQTRSTSSGK